MTRAEKKKRKQLPEAVISELAAIGLTRATEVVAMEEGQLQLRPEVICGGEAAAAIASIEKTAGGWKIKFYDKLKALALLGDYFGLFEKTAGKEEDNNLLEAILNATGKSLDTSDIQELQ